jgi:hypothetical protein
MTTNNNIVSRAWVSDFTGIDFGRIEDFDIDKAMLKVEVSKDFNPDFEHYFVDFLADYSGTEYVFELPIEITDNGVYDYENLMNLCGTTNEPVLFRSEQI